MSFHGAFIICRHWIICLCPTISQHRINVSRVHTPLCAMLAQPDYFYQKAHSHNERHAATRCGAARYFLFILQACHFAQETGIPEQHVGTNWTFSGQFKCKWSRTATSMVWACLILICANINFFLLPRRVAQKNLSRSWWVIAENLVTVTNMNIIE